jgi:hypothetical protein
VRMFSPGRFLVHLSKWTAGQVWSDISRVRATNTGCPHPRVVRMLVKRAYKVQIPCHSIF